MDELSEQELQQGLIQLQGRNVTSTGVNLVYNVVLASEYVAPGTGRR